ncbi:phosphotransferase, partial [Ilumatobacter sp.]|uniref:phosphotransferase n=1 Tax=Ilumatobacter sp. TaxID=1967498 RepID=UPI003C65BDB1
MTDPHLDIILRDRFGLDVAEIRPLPGEVDLNALVSTTGGDRYVLKFHATGAPHDELDMQDAALAHVAATDATSAVPRVVGRHVVEIDDMQRVARLLTWVDGRPTSGARLSADLLHKIGIVVARTDLSLGTFTHPSVGRRYRWNMMQCGGLATPSDPWAASTLETFRNDVLPRLHELDQQTIHNDANDENIVVDDHGSAALIDYGDIVHSPRIVGLGVAIAYAMFGQLDPLSAAAEVVAGYHEVAPLEPDELALLDGVVRTRLAMSFAIAEAQVRERPENVDYLTTSQESIGDLVDLLRHIPPELAHATYRDACGYLPIADQRAVENFFDSVDFSPAPIVPTDLVDAQIIDWSTTADRSQRVPDDRPSLGRYGELRAIYDTDAFATPSGERRTLHLGIDVFVPSGTPVASPLAGTIHSCDVRDQPGDY